MARGRFLRWLRERSYHGKVDLSYLSGVARGRTYIVMSEPYPHEKWHMDEGYTELDPNYLPGNAWDRLLRLTPKGKNELELEVWDNETCPVCGEGTYWEYDVCLGCGTTLDMIDEALLKECGLKYPETEHGGDFHERADTM